MQKPKGVNKAEQSVKPFDLGELRFEKGCNWLVLHTKKRETDDFGLIGSVFGFNQDLRVLSLIRVESRPRRGTRIGNVLGLPVYSFSSTARILAFAPTPYPGCHVGAAPLGSCSRYHGSPLIACPHDHTTRNRIRS
jgi:hypothetical protein